MALPLPSPELLRGTWIAGYTPLSLVTTPITPQRITNPIPKIGGDFTATAALLAIQFDGLGSHSGKIVMNFAGTVTAGGVLVNPPTGVEPIPPRTFSGSYDIKVDEVVEIVEGSIILRFPASDIFAPNQTASLHFFMISHEEMMFILESASVPTPNGFVPTAGGAVVRGTLKRVRPVGVPEPIAGAAPQL